MSRIYHKINVKYIDITMIFPEANSDVILIVLHCVFVFYLSINLDSTQCL